MALDDDTRILARVALFDGFSPDQLRLLAFGAEHIELNRGRILYRENDDADCAFVLVKGRLDLFRGKVDSPVPAGTRGPGAMLGAIAMITESIRPTSAIAVADSDLLKLGRKTFRRILDEYPDLAVLLHKRIFDEFRSLVQQVEALAPRFAD